MRNVYIILVLKQWSGASQNWINILPNEFDRNLCVLRVCRILSANTGDSPLSITIGIFMDDFCYKKSRVIIVEMEKTLPICVCNTPKLNSYCLQTIEP